MTLPRVIASSVIRSSREGQSHGGLTLVDLEGGTHECVLDWANADISFAGRGQERGLRGLAFDGDRMYLAAADEVYIYTPDFRRVATLRNRYLAHCHEICIDEGRLYLTSTGFNAILVVDLASQRFVDGYCFAHSNLYRLAKKLGVRTVPAMRRFDPEGADGPPPGGPLHINNVFVQENLVLVSGTNLASVLDVHGGEASVIGRVPFGTHNVRPYRDGLLFNDTASDRVAYTTKSGAYLETFAVPRYEAQALTCADTPSDHARQAFARGLCVTDDGLIVVGSSPATVSVFEHGAKAPIRSVNLTMDVRNAIHGLEVWPYS